MNPAINVHKGARKPDQNRDRSQTTKVSSTQEPSEKKSKKEVKKEKKAMGTFLKVVLGIFAFVIVSVISIIGITFYAGSAVVSAVADSANQEVVQRIETSDAQTTIYLPLQKEYGYVITGYKKCFNYAGIGDEPATSSSCINGNCEITVTIDTASIPENVSLFVEQGNECKAKEFQVGDRIDVINYFVKLEMNEALLSALDIQTNQYSVSSLNANGHSSYQIMGTKKVSLDYGKDVPLNDTLIIDGQNRASLVFNRD